MRTRARGSGAKDDPKRRPPSWRRLTGSKTSIWQSKWTASCVAWLLRLYRVASDGGLCALLIMCDFAPSHAYLISSRVGDPSSSVISSSCGQEEHAFREEDLACPSRRAGNDRTQDARASQGRISFSPTTHLLHRALGLKEDPPTQQLAEDATYAPHVHRGGVVPRAHQDFRRAIILRHHFLGHVHVLIGLRHPGQSEITDLGKEKVWCA